MYNNSMKDLLVTYVQGEKFFSNFDCEIFLNSLSKFKSFDKLCVVKDLSISSKEQLKKYFDYVIDPIHPINVPNCDRFMSYYEWLVNNPKYEYVFHVDYRDIIIQKNPFEYMRNNPDYNMFVVAEGMKVSENECNLYWARDFNNLLQSHRNDFTDHLILNTGTIGAKFETFLQICLLLFTNTNRLAPHVVFEQPVFNYLYPYFKLNPFIKICHPLKNNFCVTGEGVKRGHVDIKFDGKIVRNLNNEAYYIVHQWDRLSCAEVIRENKKNSFSFF